VAVPVGLPSGEQALPPDQYLVGAEIGACPLVTVELFAINSSRKQSWFKEVLWVWIAICCGREGGGK